MAWFVPDLALVAASFTVFYCLFLFQGYRRLFNDSDTGWHIRTGERILSQWELPYEDPYSFTKAGEPWFAWEWGADVLMGAAHQVAGLPGVALLFALAIAAGVWLWFRLHWRVGGNFLLAGLSVPLLVSTCQIHWLARPHVFSWLFLLGAILYAEKASEPFHSRQAAAIAAGSMLWANMHGTFFFAPMIALLYAASHALRPVIWRVDPRPERRKTRWFLLAALVSALASLVNPYRWELHKHVFSYLTDGELLRRIAEYQSYDFRGEGSFQIMLTLGIAFAGAVFALSQKKLAHFILGVVLAGMALRTARLLPLVALILLPLANGAITYALESWSGLEPRFLSTLDRFLRYCRRLRMIDAGMNGLAMVPLLTAACFALLHIPSIAARTGFPPDQFPVDAAAEVEKLPPDARIFAPDRFGGYLIYRFAGQRKVFFDGRSDLYGGSFLKEYGRLIAARPGWRERFEAFGFTHALLPPDAALVAALETLGWKRVYGDRVAILLARG